MKETFHNFRMWLELNRGKEPDRAKKLATRLRTIESLYSEHTDKGDNYLRSFYGKFQAAHNIRFGEFHIHKDFDRLKKEYKEIYNNLTKGSVPFEGITSGVRDEFKTAVREYLLFIAAMTGKLKEDDVYECCRTQRREPYHEIVPPQIFKHGVFNALRKAKYIFTEKESKVVAQTLDALHNLMETYLKEYEEYKEHEKHGKRGNEDLIASTSFMRESGSNQSFDWRSFDWRSKFVDALHLKVGDAVIPTHNCDWFNMANGGLTVSIKGTQQTFEIPCVSRLSSRSPKLLFLPSYTGDIFERQSCVDTILDACVRINKCLKQLTHNKHIDSFDRLMFEIEQTGSDTELQALSQQAMHALQNYASRFVIQIGIETPVLVCLEQTDKPKIAVHPNHQ